MSWAELTLLCGSILEGRMVCDNQQQKQHVWLVHGWISVYARVSECTIRSGKHHRHRIMSRPRTEQQNRLSIVFYPHSGCCADGRGWAGVSLLCRWSRG